ACGAIRRSGPERRLTARWHEGTVQGVCEPGIDLGDNAQAHPHQLASAPDQVARWHAVAGESRGQGPVEIEPHGIWNSRRPHEAADRRRIAARIDVHADDAEASRGIPALQVGQDGNLDAARETPDRPDVQEDDLAVDGAQRYWGAVERDGSGVEWSRGSRRRSVAPPARGDCRETQDHGRNGRTASPLWHHGAAGSSTPPGPRGSSSAPDLTTPLTLQSHPARHTACARPGSPRAR